MTNAGSSARTVTVKVDAHSELMTEYPWSFGGVTPNACRQPAGLRRSTTTRRGRSSSGTRASCRIRMRPSTTTQRWSPPTMTARHGRDRRVAERVPRAAGHERLHGRGAPDRVRRRPVRQGQGRPAALLDHRPRRRVKDPVGRRGGLRQGACGGSKRAPGRPSRSGRAARGQGGSARALGPLLPALAAGRPAPPSGGRLGQAEPPGSHAGR